MMNTLVLMYVLIQHLLVLQISLPIARDCHNLPMAQHLYECKVNECMLHTAQVCGEV